ncbi:hypothetical protein OAP63_04530 [Vibrio sp.]|nr:hypothetical protein [Vibrio sp.]
MLKKYLLVTGILFNAVILYSVFSFTERLAQSSSLPPVLMKTAAKLADYPMTEPVSGVVSKIATTLESPVYHWKHFDKERWPMVGSNFQAPPVSILPTSKKIYVTDTLELEKALKDVKPGTTIVVSDGEYELNSKRIQTSNIPPTQLLPVILVAENPGNVTLKMNSLEGIFLNQPYWTISGFQFVGACNNHNSCEHAIHIVGNAHETKIINNDFVDFNAAIKVNRGNNYYPDNGQVEYNHFYFTKPRSTKYSVTPINIDHANSWTVSHNIIRDFIKLEGNRISYGAFMKGGANDGVFENNLVICNSTEKQYTTATIGLSIGGGGMNDIRDGQSYQANRTIIRNNIILHCSDVGIYVNNGKDSMINNNTMYNTLGIDLRFKDSSAVVVNNIFSGHLKERDGAQILSSIGNKIFPRDFFTNGEELNHVFLSPDIGNLKIIDPDFDIHSEAVPYPLNNQINVVDFCGKAVTEKDQFIGAFNERNGCFPEDTN